MTYCDEENFLNQIGQYVSWVLDKRRKFKQVSDSMGETTDI